jgi:hypothetical protein
LLSTAGCASLSGRIASWPPESARSVEIAGVPFHPQTEYQCGPAALATLLGSTGLNVAPDSLTGEVFLPGRRGSLQSELIAALRRRERLAYELAPDFAALVAELESGRPVLVLQNFGVPLWPRWHYAVVIGFDREADRLLLRSGTTERLRMRRTWFESSWRRADRWAVVAVPPGEVPATATAERYLRAAADLETVDQRDAAARAYAAAASRWPENPLARVALANAQLAGGRAELAERTLRDAVTAGAADAVVHNNLADLLARRGCRNGALAQLRLAENPAAPLAAPIAEAIEATRREIEAMPAGAAGEEPAGCAPATAEPAR